MKSLKSTFLVICVIMLALYFRPQSQKTTSEQEVLPNGAIVKISLPGQLSKIALLGQSLYTVNCASCHGQNAVGQIDIAPPLVHKIYEPSHHGDESFQLAVARGVRSHHWRFGNMPAIEGLTREDVASITRYIRELQKTNNIL